MCGRFSLTGGLESIKRLIEGLEIDFDLAPRYNIAPGQDIAVLLNDGGTAVRMARWGLIPAWSRDAAIGSRLINARAETLHEKPSFKTPFRKRRCLIFADGFYEWLKLPGSARKVPQYVRMRSREAFALAGLWDLWTDRADATNRVLSATIITTTPNAVVAPIHDRMPAIMGKNRYAEWLAPGEKESAELHNLLGPYPAEEMEAYPVSLAVNNPAHDSDACIAPLPS